jgi:ASC-1-like (ASCH) protein
MANPFEQFVKREEENPFAQYATPQPATDENPFAQFTAPKAAEEVTPTTVEPTVRKEVEVGEATSNPFKGAVARASNLLGSGIEGFQRLTQGLGERMEGALTEEEKAGMDKMLKAQGPDIIKNLSKQKVFEPMQDWTASLRDYGKEINYQPSQKLGDIADNPLTIVPFIAERIVASAPDMVAAATIAPAYLVSLSNEILNERLKNDKKELKDATVSDVAIATGAAVVEATLERFATRGLLKPTAAKTGTGRVGKETAIQSGTEALEEGAGYLGGTAGTVKGVDYKELGQSMLEGAIVGGGLGATVQGTKEGYAKYQERAQDNDYKEAMATILQDKGFSLAPKPEQDAVVQSVLETSKEKLSSLVDDVKETLASYLPSKTPEAYGEPGEVSMEQLTSRYRNLGLTQEQAQELAVADFTEAGLPIPTPTPTPSTETVSTPMEVPSGRIEPIPGAAEPSVPTPQIQTELQPVTPGAPGIEPQRLGGALEPVGPVGSGEAAQPSALEPAQIRNQANTEAFELYKVPKTENSDGTFTYSMPTPVVKKQIDAYSLGAFDAAQGFDGAKFAADMKGKEKKAYEDGFTFGQQAVTPEVAPTLEAEPKVVTRGKAGRPKAILTPEEAAAKKQVRATQVKEWKATNKELLAAKDVLDLPAPVRDDFASQDAYLDSSMQFRANRNKALDLLNGIATGPRRGTALAKTAQESLANPSITPQELASLKEREALRKGTARSEELLESTNGEDNPEFTKFTNASQAISWIAKNGNAFEKFLVKRLEPFLRNVKLVVVTDPNTDVPASRRQDFIGANGMYFESKKERVIYLDAQGGINNTVFLHEALHGATLARINQYLDDVAEGREPNPKLAEAVEELNAIMKRAGRFYEALKAANLTDARTDEFARVNAFGDLKEFVAYGMSSPALQEFLMQLPGMYAGATTQAPQGLFTRFVQSIRKVFNMGPEHDSSMQDLIIVTDKLLRAPDAQVVTADSAPAKKAKKATEKVDKDLQSIEASNDAFKVTNALGSMITERDFGNFKDLLNARYEDMGNGFISKTLYTMQTVDILRWKGDEIPALMEVDKLQQQMSAMRTNMLAASADKADQLGAFVRKNGMETLSDAMHLARIKEVSPTKYTDRADALKNDANIKFYESIIADPNTAPASVVGYKGQLTQRKKDIDAVFAAWEKLGKQKGGHDIYKMVRQFYIDNYNLTRNLLDEQINELQIDPAAKANLMKSIRLMHEQAAVRDDATGKKTKALPEEYFPLMREGKYWLRITGGPNGREFYLFENGVDRNVFLKQRARKLGLDVDDPKFSAGDDVTTLRKDYAAGSELLQEMFRTIDEIKTTDKRFSPSNYPKATDPEAAAALALEKYKDELKDQLYQTYLMTMPERSYRKQFLHAEKVTGFSADVFRNFKISATKIANQAAKLKYSTKILNQVDAARSTLDGMPALERAKLELFVNEIGKRAQEEINPPEQGAFVTGVNQFAFIMLLTSGASAATQMASIPIMVMPNLQQQYGYKDSSVKLAKYMNFLKSIGVTKLDPNNGDVTYTAPSIGSSSWVKASPILQKAFQAGLEREVMTGTNTAVLTNKNRTPDNSYASLPGVATRTAFNAMSAMFNGAERLSREMTFMMTFELEYAKSKNFDEAVQKATDTTHETLGRYDSFNRPRILRNALGRTVGQFKMYAVYMTSFFMRNFYNSIRISVPPAERAAAMQRMAGVLVMGGMFHGLVGMPLYGVITNTVDALLNEFGDEEEKKQRRAKNPLTSDNSNLRFRYEFLPENFGHIEITGLDGRKHRLSELLEKGPISALTDINIGSRTSFDGMWFRDPNPGRNWKETAINILSTNLGPGVSTGLNLTGAIDDFSKGEVLRGLEKSVPALFRTPITAYRIGTEGAETTKGADMLSRDEINNRNLIAQAIGFPPTRLARIQEQSFESQKEVRKAQDQRAKILDGLHRVAFDPEGDKADLKEVFENIKKYNRRYPIEKFVIDIDTIERSLEAYANKRGMTYRGQVIEEKLAPYLGPLYRATVPLK